MSRHVVIVNDSSTARGGATGLALLSARLLRDRGIDVTLFTGDDGANPELARIGVEVVAVGGARLLQQPKWQAATAGLYNTAARDSLAALIAERDTPDTVYHVHVWSQILSPSVFTALQKVAPRVLTHAHDLFLACPNSVFTDYKRGVPCRRKPLGLDCLTTNCDKRSYAHKLWRVTRHAGLLRAFDQRLDWGGIAILHPGMVPLMELGGYAPDRLHVVRNPVTPYTESRIEAERNDRLLFVGRIEDDKGVRELIAAAAQAEMPLTVVGEGALRAELQAAHPEVAFAGWQDRAGIARLAARARAVVMPSRHSEPFALVVAEASQSGLPVLVANSALLTPEIVENGLGLGFDMARHGDLALTLRRFRALSDDAVAGMSRRGFDRVLPLANTPQGWIGEIIGLYDGLTG